MSGKIQVLKCLKYLICLTLLLDINACKEIDPHADTDEYTYMPLTPKLIRELGGADSLYKYQFYLSNSFELRRVDNEKSYAGQGAANNIDNNYIVVFDKLTPGVFFNTDWFLEDRSSFHIYIKRISIKFEDSLNAYLNFACVGDSNESYFYHVKGEHYQNLYFKPLFSRDFLLEGNPVKDKKSKLYHLESRSDLFYTYKNHLWHKNMDVKVNYPVETYLIIRIKNISNTTTERAKGIVVPDSF